MPDVAEKPTKEKKTVSVGDVLFKPWLADIPEDFLHFVKHPWSKSGP